MTAGLGEVQAAATPAPVQLRRGARQAARAAARAAFAPRPAATGWPATHADRDSVLAMLSRAPFTPANPAGRNGQLRGVNLALAWLAGQPGGTWQQRWRASGAEQARAGWQQRCAAGWLDDHGVHAGQRLELLSIGLILAICADVIRPSPQWLAAPGVSAGALARNLERSRDPDGFARLRATAGEAGPPAAKARHATIGRAAVIIAAKGGTLADITAGDFWNRSTPSGTSTDGPATTARCRGGCSTRPAPSARTCPDRSPSC